MQLLSQSLEISRDARTLINLNRMREHSKTSINKTKDRYYTQTTSQTEMSRGENFTVERTVQSL